MVCSTDTEWCYRYRAADVSKRKETVSFAELAHFYASSQFYIHCFYQGSLEVIRLKRILNYFRSIPSRWKLIWPLAKNDFKSRYATSQLGMFWAFFRPIVMACVYIFVFAVIARAAPVGGIYPYSLWMLPGLIVWFVFSESIASGVNTLTEYSYLVKNIRFNISILPDVKVVAAFIIHVFFVALIIVIYLLNGLPIKLNIIQLPYYMIATFYFTLAFTRIVCTAQPFFKDLSSAVEIILMVGIWACPIMWDLGVLPSEYHLIFKANPLYHLVTGYRECYMGDTWFWNHPISFCEFWVITILLDLWGRRMFRRLSSQFADVI